MTVLQHRCCDLLVVVYVHLPEYVVEIRVGDEVVLPDALHAPPSSSEVAYDVLRSYL